jgi:phosphoglucosamine mutase
VLRFGTDGVRGNADDLTPKLMVALGRAAARVVGTDGFLVGRDTRVSGARIEHQLKAGMRLDGIEPTSLGVLPTPAIAFSAANEYLPAAIVSASHNPWTDNGVKIIGPDGRKLPDAAEGAIERELEAAVDLAIPDGEPELLFGAEASHAQAYAEHVVGALGERSLSGLRVVLDCANGAGFAVAPSALRAAGADVIVMHDDPDGRNINDACGSTHPESLQAAVVEHGAVLGLALDGDADRVLAVDERGALVDGDQIMVMTALDLHARGELRENAVVVTVMSNLGLRRALAAAGIEVIETPVGDRHVVVAMLENGAMIGGEQSGHIVYSEHATTGDGLLTGLLVCDLVHRSGRALSDIAAQMTRYPQVLVNVRVAARVDLEEVAALWEAVHEVERELGDEGRVLVRSSGTEPLVRVMVEASTPGVARAVTERLRKVVVAELGGS